MHYAIKCSYNNIHKFVPSAWRYQYESYVKINQILIVFKIGMVTLRSRPVYPVVARREGLRRRGRGAGCGSAHRVHGSRTGRHAVVTGGPSVWTSLSSIGGGAGLSEPYVLDRSSISLRPCKIVERVLFIQTAMYCMLQYLSF